MDWLFYLTAIIGGVLIVMAMGVPVAFAFLTVTAIAAFALQGSTAAFGQMVLSMFAGVGSFSLVPIPLFIFMGVVLWHSRIGGRALDALSKLMGRLPGRLSLLTVAAGTVFSSLSGSTMANTALLGSLLMPEMRQRGYSKQMIIGPIMASGGLAMMIPPSALAVILASIGKISVAKILVGAIVPGIMMALFYAAYVVVRAWIYPQEAPAYEMGKVGWVERLRAIAVDLLPLGLIIFSVTGLIVLGIATPTEAAALGALSALALAGIYGSLSISLVKVAVRDSLTMTVMTFAIIAAASGFSQVLAFSGATRGLLDAVLSLDVSPIVLTIGMQLVILLLGCFMEQVAIMLITLPIFIPIILAVGLDPVWFGVIVLINLETALMTPPFGLLIFVMKGAAPADVSFRDIYVAAMPFIVINIAVMAILTAFPDWVTALGSIVK